MTADELAAIRLYACSDNCKTVYQAHYEKHEPNCQGEEILELCDEIERLKDIAALNGRRCLLWRACADQLAAALRFRGATQMGREALAVHERLKAEAES